MRIDRMLGITVMLLNRDRISARELSDKYEVSIRTIYRDIEAINMAGIPVVAHSGSNGGFGIMSNYKIDRQLLTLNDMVSILSALKGMNATLEDRELDEAIEKITSLVPADKTEHLASRLEHVSIDIQPWGYRERQKQHIKTVHEAIFNHLLISFTYSNSKGEVVERTVEPMTLLFKGYAWYLFAFCKLKNDFRLFKLSRMKELVVQDEIFKRKNVKYEEHFSSSSENVKMIRMLLKFSPKVRMKVEEYFEDEHIEYLSNGEMIAAFDAPEDDWVYSMILGFGDYVEVIEPKHMRSAIKEKTEKILALYKHDITVSHS
ncbi:MAG: YafY family transcriptional regulator [Bacteroidetes bacterium]|nr:YafY family transcriptional regulator [Bacteroidota bacterium]